MNVTAAVAVTVMSIVPRKIIVRQEMKDDMEVMEAAIIIRRGLLTNTTRVLIRI
jgi:hypothetical protein